MTPEAISRILDTTPVESGFWHVLPGGTSPESLALCPRRAFMLDVGPQGLPGLWGPRKGPGAKSRPRAPSGGGLARARGA